MTLPAGHLGKVGLKRLPVQHCKTAQISLRNSLAPRRKMFKDLFGNSRESSSLGVIMRPSIDKRSITEGELGAICSRDG